MSPASSALGEGMDADLFRARCGSNRGVYPADEVEALGLRLPRARGQVDPRVTTSQPLRLRARRRRSRPRPSRRWSALVQMRLSSAVSSSYALERSAGDRRSPSRRSSTNAPRGAANSSAGYRVQLGGGALAEEVAVAGVVLALEVGEQWLREFVGRRDVAELVIPRRRLEGLRPRHGRAPSALLQAFAASRLATSSRTIGMT